MLSRMWDRVSRYFVFVKNEILYKFCKFILQNLWCKECISFDYEKCFKAEIIIYRVYGVKNVYIRTKKIKVVIPTVMYLIVVPSSQTPDSLVLSAISPCQISPKVVWWKGVSSFLVCLDHICVQSPCI